MRYQALFSSGLSYTITQPSKEKLTCSISYKMLFLSSSILHFIIWQIPETGSSSYSLRACSLAIGSKPEPKPAYHVFFLIIPNAVIKTEC